MNKAHQQLVNKQLLGRDINNTHVLKAFERVDRAQFVPYNLQAYAYDDHPLPIGEQQTISQPYIIALMIQHTNPSKDKKVLEIGTGSGYQTAILAEIFDHVYTVERIDTLYQSAKQTLDKLEFQNISYKLGDGKEGWGEHSPYDAIILSAAASEFPNKLLEQLADNGRMVLPLSTGVFQDLMVYEKRGGRLNKRSLGGCRFVPLL